MRFNVTHVLPLIALLLIGNAYALPADIDASPPEPFGQVIPKVGAGSTAILESLNSMRVLAEESFIGRQAGQSLARVRPDRVARGAEEVKVYKEFSPAVVLIVTRDGLGTGTLLNSKGEILTNWHVIGSAKDVGVVFKPKVEGKEITKADLVRAKVLKVDEVADLALVRVEKIPAGIEPITLGAMSDLSVGSDVHAIGHPTGEAWTYTKGVVSQIRQNYPWTTKDTQKSHKANVIQTQTPINPGNSGGPLLTSDGRLVGVNSFSSKGEGLNFAVAVDEVRRFVDASGNRLAENAKPYGGKKAAKGECEIKELYRGTDAKDTAELTSIDTDCDGKAEIHLRKPYDIRHPITIAVDENKDGIPDAVIYDADRDGKWDYSLRDTNFDGKKWDLECEHEDGGLEPTRCVPYQKKSK